MSKYFDAAFGYGKPLLVIYKGFSFVLKEEDY
ncbi:hypothetical protein SAMN05216243_0470 [Sediminibacillus albus]|uniref:Uncharacterized protein n=1 Tax=Sediminibacillus albus TaxID=407036 RepID=A0A1G8W000_9BACI|nr:hypothetical protein SAMN05216243_0470 [Sediminibacillus albus]